MLRGEDVVWWGGGGTYIFFSKTRDNIWGKGSQWHDDANLFRCVTQKNERRKWPPFDVIYIVTYF